MSRSRFALAAAVLASLALLPVPALAEPGRDEGDARARLAAAALDASVVRMRALVEQAGVLDGLGRHEEALAALKKVEEAYLEGIALSKAVLAPAPAAGPASPATVPEPRRAPDSGGPTIPIEAGRPAIEVRRPQALPPADPNDPIAMGVRYLVATQGPYGLWGPYGKGKRQDHVHVPPEAIADTAWAVLALLDAVEDVEAETPQAMAIHWGVRALLDRQDRRPRGGAGAEAEARVLSAWAIAAAYGRTGRAEWRAAVDATLDPVVQATLADARAWIGADPRPDRFVLSAWVAALLHEARPLDGAIRAEVVDRALGALASGASIQEARGGGYATALVLRAARRTPPGTLVPPLGSGGLDAGDGDAADLLLGTTYHAHASKATEWDLWRDTRLAWATARQRQKGDDAGAWDSDPRMGPVRETAMHLLALLVPHVPYREPVAKDARSR